MTPTRASGEASEGRVPYLSCVRSESETAFGRREEVRVAPPTPECAAGSGFSPRRGSGAVEMRRPALFALAVSVLLLATAAPNASATPTQTPREHGTVAASLSSSTVRPSAHAAPDPSRRSLGAAPSAAPSNVLVDAPCNATSGNAEVEQAYDPALGYLYEAWIGCGGIGFSRSTDGGATFGAAFPVPGSQPPYGSSWDPAIALAPNGTLYVAFMVSVPGDAPVVAWSYDHGASFAGFAYAYTPAGSEFSDRDFIAVAPNGTLYLTWDYSPNASEDSIACAYGGSCYFTNGDYNIVCVTSTDGGRNWTTPVAVDPEYPNGAAPAGPLLVEPNGNVDVLYEDYNVTGATHALGVGFNYFTRSSDGGGHWSAPVRVGNASFPNTAWWIDGALSRDAGGTLYATYDSVNATNDTAWVAVSTDGGTTWTDRPVNPDHDTSAHIMVEAVGAESGVAYVAWMANNTSGEWSTYEAPLWANGGVEGPVTTVSGQLGLVGYWPGDTIGISYLGVGRVAVSWSYGVVLGGVTASQVFAAVLPGAVPSSPVVTGVSTGHGWADVRWAPGSGGTPAESYRVEWGTEGNFSANVTVAATMQNATISPLLAFARYSLRVIAVDAAGDSPPSPAVNVTLTAWTVVAGTVTPATAHVNIDAIPQTVVNGAFSENTTFSPHAVSAIAPNFGPSQAITQALWNGTAIVTLVLTPLNGTVRGVLSPVVANLTWDGGAAVVFGDGTFTIAATPGTMHVLRASYPGLVPFEQNLSVASNTTAWVNISLAPLPGSLHFAVAPSNATVRVGNVSVQIDTTGNGTLALPPGKYAWHVSAIGFVDVFGNATVRSAETTNVSVALNRTAETGPPGGGGSSGLPTGTLVELLLVAVVLVAIVVVALAVRRRPPPPDAEVPEELRVEAEPVDEPVETPLEGTAGALPRSGSG